MYRYEAELRFGRQSDIPEICELERKVWGEHNVSSVTEDILEGWLRAHTEGFVVGVYKSRIRGYGYFVHTDFDVLTLDASWPLASTSFTEVPHTEGGNSLYGVNATADLPGLGIQLFSRMRELGVARKKGHVANLIRMQGLATFLRGLQGSMSETERYGKETLALWYAMRCVQGVGGSIAPALKDSMPAGFFPEHVKKDPVLTYPARLAPMMLHGVVPSSYDDPESMNLLALVTIPCS